VNDSFLFSALTDFLIF